MDARVQAEGVQVIFEVKTALEGDRVEQMRLGVGQLLHYRSLLGYLAAVTVLALVIDWHAGIGIPERRYLAAAGVTLVTATPYGFEGLAELLAALPRRPSSSSAGHLTS